MDLRNTLIVILLSPVLIQGLCNKEEVQKTSCSEMTTLIGSGNGGFYKSTEHDSHFRELYFTASDTPDSICIENEVTATFTITSVSGVKIQNVNQIEGKVIWGDQFLDIVLPYSDADHAYIGSIEYIDLKPYFDEHPTPDGSGYINAEFIWYNLSVGSEATDLQFVLDIVSDMEVEIEYIRL